MVILRTLYCSFCSHLFDPIATFQLITHLKKTILPAIPLLAMNTLMTSSDDSLSSVFRDELFRGCHVFLLPASGSVRRSRKSGRRRWGMIQTKKSAGSRHGRSHTTSSGIGQRRSTQFADVVIAEPSAFVHVIGGGRCHGDYCLRRRRHRLDAAGSLAS